MEPSRGSQNYSNTSMITDDDNRNIMKGNYSYNNVTTLQSKDNNYRQEMSIIKNVQLSICVFGVIGNLIVIFILS